MDRDDPQSFHRIRPSLPVRKAVADTPGPPMTDRLQHPNDIVAGRTTKFELTSSRNRRGSELAATEVAAVPQAIRPIAAIDFAVFRIRRIHQHMGASAVSVTATVPRASRPV